MPNSITSLSSCCPCLARSPSIKARFLIIHRRRQLTHIPRYLCALLLYSPIDRLRQCTLNIFWIAPKMLMILLFLLLLVKSSRRYLPKKLLVTKFVTFTDFLELMAVPKRLLFGSRSRSRSPLFLFK